MNILLCTSPHLKHASVLEADFHPRNDLMYSFAPLGLLMLCAMVRERFGETPVIYDTNKKINTDEIANTNNFYVSAALSISSYKPEVVGFMTECDSYHHVLQICLETKRANPDCYIILGGPHATAVGLATLEKWPCIDCIVLGEGEEAFIDILENIKNGTHEVVAGTVMRDSHGKPVMGENRPLVASLDLLPFPAYDLYTPSPGEELFLEVGRGCPFQCTFCSTSPFWQRKHRVKSPKRIIEELAYIRSFHQVERVHFTHDLFTANPQWVAEVCHEFIHSRVNVKWTCSSRIDTITEPLIALMAEAGCNAIFFGIESGSERVLQKIQKDIPLHKTIEIISVCEKYGITPNGGLIVGFPFEDNTSMRETFAAYQLLMKLGMKPLHIFSYCPFSQSSLYSTLSDIDCSGHFMDIPLPIELDRKNRDLVKSDPQLFGSYYKPNLPGISRLDPGVLYGVDEFALLVDALRVPALSIADEVGGMEELFFLWIDYIEEYNLRFSKPDYRKYMGSPLDFCEFLLQLAEKPGMGNEPHIHVLLRVQKKNFEIARQLSYASPTTMATYRSKTMPAQLTEIHYTSKVIVADMLDAMTIDYDITALLRNTAIIDQAVPEKRKVHLIWHRSPDGNISLVEVSGFLFKILTNPSQPALSINDLLSEYVRFSETAKTEVNFSDILNDLRTAQERDIILIK